MNGYIAPSNVSQAAAESEFTIPFLLNNSPSEGVARFISNVLDSNEVDALSLDELERAAPETLYNALHLPQNTAPLFPDEEQFSDSLLFAANAYGTEY